MSLLEVSHLSRRFGGLRAVEDVSFSLEACGINALIGPNGAGKTTLFNMIAGALPPSSGRTVFDGRDLTGMAPQRIARLGLIRTFQLTRLFAEMSAEENVRVGFHLSLRGGVWAALARPPRVRAAERDAARDARALLDLVGLANQAHLPAAQLTYGQQRLLEVARALAARPKLLLLDEPAAGLDTGETAALGTLLETIRQRGVTILLIEHDMRLVMKVAQQAIVLDFGRKIAEGTPLAVSRDPTVLEAYLGDVEERAIA